MKLPRKEIRYSAKTLGKIIFLYENSSRKNDKDAQEFIAYHRRSIRFYNRIFGYLYFAMFAIFGAYCAIIFSAMIAAAPNGH